MINLPTGPLKASDLQPILTAFDQLVAAIDAHVNANDARITALEQGRLATVEHGLAEHQAGAEARLLQIRELEAQVRKATWRMAHPRR